MSFARSSLDNDGTQREGAAGNLQEAKSASGVDKVQVDKVGFLSQDVEKVNESPRALHEIPCSMFQAMCRSDDRKVNGYL